MIDIASVKFTRIKKDRKISIALISSIYQYQVSPFNFHLNQFPMEQSDQKPFEGAKNPCEHASIFSKLSFWYTRDLFYKGFNTVLQQNDLYRPLKSDESEVLGDRLEK